MMLNTAGSGSAPGAGEWSYGAQGAVEETTSDYDREKLQERLAKLAGGGCGDPRRRRHRGRGEGTQGPGRRRDARNSSGRRGRNCRRRRRSAPLRDQSARHTEAGERRSEGRHRYRPARAAGTRAPDRGALGHARLDRRRQAAREHRHKSRASTRSPAHTSTC